MGVDHQNHTVHQANEYNQLGHMVESSPGTNGLISNTGGFGRLFVLPSSDRSAKESGWVAGRESAGRQHHQRRR